MAPRPPLNRAIAVLFGLALASSANGTDFDAMARCSSADVKALKFFDVGQASLFRQDCAAPDPLAPPMRLAFGYNREVPGDAFAKAARKMIERNVSDATFEALKKRIDAFNSHYRTTRDGDLYTLDYGADQSMVLRLNGEKLAEEQGEDFAQAYFSIWFGDDPYSDDLKQELLSIQP
ncbi:MAG TPA: chalcone isomerase family protein [Alcanivorax sp.]|nr:chalcone isomerase family protein [Alcanivorax sp.]